MKKVLKRIDKHCKDLPRNPFCLSLKDNSLSAQEKIQFIPYIFEVVMGFRNFLELVQVQNPKSDLEKLINVHCNEDEGHWKWYLADLKRLNFTEKFTLSDFGNFVSNENSIQIRNFFNIGIRFALSSNNLHKTLTVIEVLEAGFAIFISHVLEPIKAMNLYAELDYFGKTHFDAETSHEAGNWVDDSAQTELSSYELNEKDQLEAIRIVDLMFEEMNKMFLNWHNSIRSSSNEIVFSKN